jgi:two-component system, OmpR family, phosphate regulon sensor histidine kinase PhoR
VIRRSRVNLGTLDVRSLRANKGKSQQVESDERRQGRAEMVRLLMASGFVGAAATLGAYIDSPIAGGALAAVTALGFAIAFRNHEPMLQVPAVVDTTALVVDVSRDDPGVLEALSDPILVVDPSLKILMANESARRLFGASLVGDSLSVFLRRPDAIEAILSAQASSQPIESEINLHSPAERTYALRAARLATHSDEIVISLQDITQTKLTERMRVDFVANASHELRTPLATLIGFIETLQGPAASDAKARVRFLDIMAREADRMARLIDDLLSLSRIELDKNRKPEGIIDLPPLLADVGKTLSMRLEADERKVEISIDPSMPKVLGDRDQILQVLHNLLSNALKYGRKGTPIELGATVEAGPFDANMVRVWVRDHGEGIPAEHLPRLTERFYRIDTARSRTMGGTGLGLAIVKHIVERHLGNLAISSQLGLGTTVSFTLPLADPETTLTNVTKMKQKRHRAFTPQS